MERLTNYTQFEPLIKRLPKYADRIVLHPPALSLNPFATVPEIAFTEERLIREKMQAQYRFDHWDVTFFKPEEIGRLQTATVHRLCTAIERELEKMAKRGIEIFVHGNPEVHAKDREVFVVYDWSYKQSDRLKMIYKDGCTEEAVEKALSEMQQRLNKEIDAMFEKAFKKFR